MSAAARLRLAAISVVLVAACGSEPESVERADPRPVIRSTVPVGERGNVIHGIAVGEGAVWVATAGGCVGSVSRIDPRENRVVASTPLGEVYDVAVAAGSVWALVAKPCSRAPVPIGLLRIDPGSLEVVARVPLDLTRGGRGPDHPFELVAGEGGLWVSVNFGPTAGEVVRIDPQSNAVAARIDAAGHVGEMALGGGFVWFLSHPEWTDETRIRSASLYRIDPATNERSGALVDRELADLGGNEIAPILAAGDSAAWVRGHEESYPYGPVVLRVDAATGQVARRPLDGTRWFYPVAETDSGLWFVGDRLWRLDRGTLRIAGSAPLDIHVVDAAYDSATRTLWLAALPRRSNERGVVVRVALP